MQCPEVGSPGGQRVRLALEGSPGREGGQWVWGSLQVGLEGMLERPSLEEDS